MGLMDKVKAQATVLADKAQTGMQQGQTKLQELQMGKQEDRLLRELGAHVFLSERGRTPPDSEAKVAAIVRELDAIEVAGTPVTITPDPSAVPPGVDVSGSGDPGSPPPAVTPPPARSAVDAVPATGNPLPRPGGAPPGGTGTIPRSSDRLPGE